MNDPDPIWLRLAATPYAEDGDEVGDLARSVYRRLERRRRLGGKECSACHEVKAVSEFGKDSTRRDGLEPRCRKCRSRG